MEQSLQNLIHHANVVVPFELVLHVHQIFVEGIQSPGEQFAHVETDDG